MNHLDRLRADNARLRAAIRAHRDVEYVDLPGNCDPEFLVALAELDATLYGAIHPVHDEVVDSSACETCDGRGHVYPPPDGGQPTFCPGCRAPEATPKADGNPICGRLLVGRGTDTWDPLCIRELGHDGLCAGDIE